MGVIEAVLSQRSPDTYGAVPFPLLADPKQLRILVARGSLAP